MSFSPAGAYPALHGRTDITNNKFINFETRSCGKNVALMANPESDDAIHPIFVSGLSFAATPRDNYVFIPRANVEKVDPSDCVDMDCDGHKKVVLKDTDGSLLGKYFFYGHGRSSRALQKKYGKKAQLLFPIKSSDISSVCIDLLESFFLFIIHSPSPFIPLPGLNLW